MATFLEQTHIFTPAGIRFRDAATEAPVTSGLHVDVVPASGGKRVRAVATTSGAYAVHVLPGRRRVSYPAEDAVAPSPEPYLIHVRDDQGRFLPALIEADLPVANGGIVSVLGEDPSETPPADEGSGGGGKDPSWYLFSAPQRPLTPGLACVRADLIDDATGAPAAHAVLEVRHDGFSGYGLAGDDGRVAVVFPYPPIELAGLEDADDTEGATESEGGGVVSTSAPAPPSTPSRIGATSAASGTRLSQKTWTLTVEVRYDPPSRPVEPTTGLPRLPDVIRQSSGVVFGAPGSASPSLTATLQFGRPCVLRTGTTSVLRVATAP